MKAFKNKNVKSESTESIYERLKEMIISRELLPNQKIVELEISKRLNVSRTPLREALRRLEAEGYVNYYKNRGAVVSYLSPEEIEERFIYFSNLLAFASSLSVEFITKKQIDELKNFDEKMSGCSTQADRIQWVAYNQSFHITLLAACPNHYLLSQLTKEGERLWRYWASAFNMVFDLNEYQDEHKEIINLVQNKDKEGIYRLVYRHTSKFVDRIKLIAGSIIT
ncbi:MAG: GntR family transcriptional regulator [Myxococcota bacterium]